ncbi:NYN domain-containing protein [Actinomyces mediterranea]|uniref:NYN domain-containing protein n=1 Tax=Actinomyces mediterranea TaxID=1871028 RepID=UPI001F1AB705|nr:NYN domain-containing protein [Actinomyces mediterranea]
MAVVIDYQNVHLTGVELYLPGRPKEEGLIDPFKFACQLAKARNKDGDHEVELARVEVYRGLPLQEDDASAYRRNLEQQANWQSGHVGVVSVNLRPLKYVWEWQHGKKVPIRSTRQEKGVDVLCALALVRLARSGMYDIVVLASRDTDLAPALDEAASLKKAKVEAAKWYDHDEKRTYGNIKTKARIWTTSMSREHFQHSLDRHDYR